jgi:hypothetical protein
MDLAVIELAVPKLSVYLRPTSSQLLWIMDVYGFLFAGFLVTVLLPNYKHRGTQVSCPPLRERRRPLTIGEVLDVVLD